MKVLFSGGGTLGPVTPLLSIRDTLRKEFPQAAFFWIGTKNGPEQAVVSAAGITSVPIASGKFRRYVSFLNVVDLGKVIVGFFQSLRFLWREDPQICISAGGFVSVPVHVAAWLLGIPTWVHAQDRRLGLTIKLLAPLATLVTVALPENVSRLPKRKTRLLGNPVRSDLFSGSRDRAVERFHLERDLPTVFVTGGGTGSLAVNTMITEAVPHLAGACQILHTTGRNRSEAAAAQVSELFPHYHAYEFFQDEMNDAYATAAVVVARGGFGTLSEVAALQKPVIFIPKPGAQEENVAWLAERGAAVVLDERVATGYHLAAEIKKLLAEPERSARMGRALQTLVPHARAEDIVAAFRSVIP